MDNAPINSIKMTPEQAIEVILSATGEISLKRKDHIIVSTAITVLKQMVEYQKLAKTASKDLNKSNDVANKKSDPISNSK